MLVSCRSNDYSSSYSIFVPRIHSSSGQPEGKMEPGNRQTLPNQETGSMDAPFGSFQIFSRSALKLRSSLIALLPADRFFANFRLNHYEVTPNLVALLAYGLNHPKYDWCIYKRHCPILGKHPSRQHHGLGFLASDPTNAQRFPGLLA